MAETKEKSGWWQTTKEQVKELGKDLLKVALIFAAGVLGLNYVKGAVA